MSSFIRNLFTPSSKAHAENDSIVAVADESSVESQANSLKSTDSTALPKAETTNLTSTPVMTTLAPPEYFTVRELSMLLPPQMVRTDGLPPDQPVHLPENVLRATLHQGRPAMRLTQIYAVCPFLFSRQVLPQEDVEISLPFQKVKRVVEGAAYGSGSAMGQSPFAQVARPEDTVIDSPFQRVTAPVVDPTMPSPFARAVVAEAAPSAPAPAPMKLPPWAGMAQPPAGAPSPFAAAMGNELPHQSPPHPFPPLATIPKGLPAAFSRIPRETPPTTHSPAESPFAFSAPPTIVAPTATNGNNLIGHNPFGPPNPVVPQAQPPVVEARSPFNFPPVARPAPPAQAEAIYANIAAPMAVMEVAPAPVAPPLIAVAQNYANRYAVPLHAPAVAAHARTPGLMIPLRAVLRDASPDELGFDPAAVPESIEVEIAMATILPQLASGRVEVGLSEILEGLSDRLRPAFSNTVPHLRLVVPLAEIFRSLPQEAVPTPTLPPRDAEIPYEPITTNAFQTPFSLKALEDPPAPSVPPLLQEAAVRAKTKPISVPGELPPIFGTPTPGVANSPFASLLHHAGGFPFASVQAGPPPNLPAPTSPAPSPFSVGQALEPSSSHLEPPALYYTPEAFAASPTVPAHPFPKVSTASPAEASFSLPTLPDFAASGRPSSFARPPGAPPPETQPAISPEPPLSALPPLMSPPFAINGDADLGTPFAASNLQSAPPIASTEAGVPPSPPSGPVEDLSFGIIDDPRQLALRAIFMTEHSLAPQNIVDLSAQFPGIRSCLIITKDGVTHSGWDSASDEVKNFSETAPRTHEYLTGLAESMGIQNQGSFTMRSDKGVRSFFIENGVCLAVLHQQAHFLPGVREKLIMVTSSLSEILS